MAEEIEAEELQSEIFNLFQYIERFREEIARINAGEDDKDHFDSMSEQLDAIVQATEDATNGILDNLEGIESVIDQLREAGGDGALRDKISEHSMLAMENCTFQDITGQRITKVVRSMKFVEERVNSMVELMGRDTVERLSESLPTEEKTEDEKLLDGPQLAGQAISQDDIDALFD
jgi:chemotaxis protein CheZ